MDNTMNTIKLSEMPWRFQTQYGGWRMQGACRLLKLGVARSSNSPGFGVQERQVENRVVRYIGERPLPDERVLVERGDGTLWSVCLTDFETHEVVDNFVA